MKTNNCTLNELRKHGVNYDYIITLIKNEDGTLKRVDVPITCLNTLLGKLERMLDDKSYSVVDMEKSILNEIEHEPLCVCIPYEYNKYYINGNEEEGSKPLVYESIDQKKTLMSLASKKDSMCTKYKRSLKWKNRDLSRSEIEILASDLAEKEYQDFLHKEKFNFLQERIGYLQAYAYKKTYDSVCNDVFFVSSERIGWPINKDKGGETWKYSINEDINVSLWSNFCYGRSSAFFVRVRYKGLQICPYSEFVTYRYAKEVDILNYTRKYELKRASWEAAADFVMDFCNKAIADPDNFIRDEITYEVKTLVRELSQIVISKEQYLKSKFGTSATPNNRFSHVADLITFNDYQLADYQKNPAEYELLFRMEKISGALKFVNSLECFSAIFKFIRRAIVKIEDLNVEIYPELSERIIPIREEVAAIKEEIRKLEEKSAEVKKKAECHYRRIAAKQNRYKNIDDKTNVKKNYYKCYPEIIELEKLINNLDSQCLQQKSLFDGRNNFLESLESCKSSMEAYGIPKLELL